MNKNIDIVLQIHFVTFEYQIFFYVLLNFSFKINIMLIYHRYKKHCDNFNKQNLDNIIFHTE